jgi:hypothetical protein
VDLDGRLERIVRIGEPEVALSTLEKALKGQAEVLAYRGEGLREESRSGLIDLPDRLAKVVPSLHEIRPLSGKELEAGALLLVLLDGEHVHRANPLDRFDHLPQLRPQLILYTIDRISLGGERLKGATPFPLETVGDSGHPSGDISRFEFEGMTPLGDAPLRCPSLTNLLLGSGHPLLEGGQYPIAVGKLGLNVSAETEEALQLCRPLLSQRAKPGPFFLEA